MLAFPVRGYSSPNKPLVTDSQRRSAVARGTAPSLGGNMNPLRITPAALQLLRELIRRSQLDEPIPCVVWSESGAALRMVGGNGVASYSLPPGWEVGFYEKATLTPGVTREVDGIQLVIEPQYWSRLADHTLDAVSGRLMVVPNNALQATRETRAPER